MAGVPVGLNWSMLVVFWLLTWSLATVGLPDSSPGHDRAAYWAFAATAALLFYASLLAHELAHSVVARRNEITVHQITLWLFGGVAQLDREPLTPDVELRIAAAGPATSMAAAAFFGLVAGAMSAARGPDLGTAAATWLAGINLTLALFNLVPAAPLDGGRILRSVLWRRHGDGVRAGVSAARAGRMFGYLLIGAGLVEFTTASTAGLWLVFLGWFLLTAARAEEQHYRLRDAFDGVLVAEVMTRDPVVASQSISVAELFDDYLWARRISAVPLIDVSGTVTGLATLDRVRRQPRSTWTETTAAEIACPIAETPVAEPDELLISLLESMVGTADGRALVIDDGVLVGIVTPTDVTRAALMRSLQTADGVSRRHRWSASADRPMVAVSAGDRKEGRPCASGPFGPVAHHDRRAG